jgi:hypothetical protein
MGYTQRTETHKWSENMHRITINVPESTFQRARIKALRENVAVSEVIRDLLAR